MEFNLPKGCLKAEGAEKLFLSNCLLGARGGAGGADPINIWQS